METTLVLLRGSGGGSSGVSSHESKVEALDSSEATSYPQGAELELGLGLGLSIAGANAWADRGRILTAKDFPSPISGTKRAADSGPQEPASLSPPRSSQVVGWPPIRSYRMNSLVNQAKTPRAEEDKALDRKGHSKDVLKNENKTSLKVNEYVGFIKVNTDGMGIGRKVDLSVHACYETLAQALEDMFFKPTSNITPIRSGGGKELAMKSSKLLDGSSEFVLTYEDKDGDWMLVGDVPWRMFVNNVKRLRIMRTSEDKGLAPRVQDTNERQRRTHV